jgi:hypothetical protein
MTHDGSWAAMGSRARRVGSQPTRSHGDLKTALQAAFSWLFWIGLPSPMEV